MKKFYTDERIAQELELLQEVYENGNIGALYDVLLLCKDFNKPLPPWASKELLKHLRNYFGGSVTGERWKKRYTQDIKHSIRAGCVMACIEHDMKWKAKLEDDELTVYNFVSSLLEGTSAKGGPDAIKNSYRKYKKECEKNPSRYFMLRIMNPLRIVDTQQFDESRSYRHLFTSLNKKPKK